MLQVSLLVEVSDLQSLTVVVGWLPNRTYRSASVSEPPVVVNRRFVAPAGTASEKNRCEPVAPEMPLTGTPFVSTVTPPGIGVAVGGTGVLVGVAVGPTGVLVGVGVAVGGTGVLVGVGVGPPVAQAGRVPQATPCALNASQMRQALG